MNIALSGMPRPRSDGGDFGGPKGPPKRVAGAEPWGASPENARWVRSFDPAHRRIAAASGIVVTLNFPPRTVPCRPRRRISRATVQRATTWPSRFICFHTLRGP